MPKIISVVTPCFNEVENVRDCYETVKRIFETELAGYRREHIFCDNDSSDGTQDILREIAGQDDDVKVILNSRNFGPMRSNFNGVLNTSGDAVLLFLPADMQDPPDLIPEFVRLWEQGNEIVYGIRAEREEGILMRLTRKLYYRILNRFSYVEFPVDVGDFQLVDRKVVEAMRLFEDTQPFMRVMTFECGFTKVGVSYKWLERKKGLSKNRLYHLVDQGLNGMISSSSVPLRLALFGGFAISLLSILYAGGTLITSLIAEGEVAAPGIPTLIVALFFFGGVQLFFLGFLGEYVLAIYGQVRRQPIVIERERINFQKSSGEDQV